MEASTALFHRVAKVCWALHYYSEQQVSYEWLGERVLGGGFLQAMVPMLVFAAVAWKEVTMFCHVSRWLPWVLQLEGSESAGSSPALCQRGLICVLALISKQHMFTCEGLYSMMLISVTRFRNKCNCSCNIRIKIYAREKYACNSRKEEEWNGV